MDIGAQTEWLAWLQGSWPEIKSTAWLVLFFLFAFALIGSLVRLKMIHEIVIGFKEARGPLWDLRTTVNQLKSLQPEISKLAGDAGLITEQIEALQEQLRDQTIESISTRIEDNGATSSNAIADTNWEALRRYWRRNTQRIENVIDQIQDGRTKLVYTRMPRTNYTRIIDKLEQAGLVTSAAAYASRELIQAFNRYRPKNKKVPDEIMGGLQVLDIQLEAELVHLTELGGTDSSEVLGQTVAAAAPAALRQDGHLDGLAAPSTNLPEDRPS